MRDLVSHDSEGVLRGEVGRCHVDGDDIVPVLQPDVFEVGFGRVHACVLRRMEVSQRAREELKRDHVEEQVQSACQNRIHQYALHWK